IRARPDPVGGTHLEPRAAHRVQPLAARVPRQASLGRGSILPATVHPVVLCGGAGTRLWPMSRRLLPKQFLPLISERTLLQETLLRTQGLGGLAEPVLLCNEDHRFLVAEQLREAGVASSRILLEPAARGTAPAVAAAALSVIETEPQA